MRGDFGDIRSVTMPFLPNVFQAELEKCRGRSNDAVKNNIRARQERVWDGEESEVHACEGEVHEKVKEMPRIECGLKRSIDEVVEDL